jgi:hypothetical protein
MYELKQNVSIKCVLQNMPLHMNKANAVPLHAMEALGEEEV